MKQKVTPVEKKCLQCGKPFLCETKREISVRVYCCRECGIIFNKEKSRERRRNERAEDKKAIAKLNTSKSKKKVKSRISLDEAAKKARELGMSYGQYMAKYYSSVS